MLDLELVRQAAGKQPWKEDGLFFRVVAAIHEHPEELLEIGEDVFWDGLPACRG